ncbi:hypothetical protein [Chryseobacterium indoltheticum]|uniref:hypothetical protein n=1 Tax=Chryseobacterium indoltheticum TaxID=254 RepID=UPI003F4915C9
MIKNLGKEALNIEKMDWKQLIVNEKNKTDFESVQIHFKLNQAIPYTVLVDNNMNILAFSVGLSDEIELRKMVKK